MIKITKPFRYAKSQKITNEILNDIKFLSVLINDLKRIRLPKNVLRCKFIRVRVGCDGDDFVRNTKTMIATFEIIKFKR